MAKVSFGKLNLNKNTSSTSITWNDQQIEVKQYLPIEEKLELITRIINQSVDENNFYNPCRIEVFSTIEIIFAYAGVSITEKQREDPCKLFDLLVSSGFADAVVFAIPEPELRNIKLAISQTIENIYKYKDSVLGILDTIRTDYKSTDFDLTELENKIQDPETLTLLKDVLTKLG